MYHHRQIGDGSADRLTHPIDGRPNLKHIKSGAELAPINRGFGRLLQGIRSEAGRIPSYLAGLPLAKFNDLLLGSIQLIFIPAEIAGWLRLSDPLILGLSRGGPKFIKGSKGWLFARLA